MYNQLKQYVVHVKNHINTNDISNDRTILEHKIATINLLTSDGYQPGKPNSSCTAARKLLYFCAFELDKRHAIRKKNINNEIIIITNVICIFGRYFNFGEINNYPIRRGVDGGVHGELPSLYEPLSDAP